MPVIDKPRIDLSNREGSMTEIIKNNMSLINDARSVPELLTTLRVLFRDNGLDTPASNRLLRNVARKKHIEDAWFAITNSYLAGTGNSVIESDMSKTSAKKKVYKIDEANKRIVSEDIQEIEVKTDESDVTISKNGDAVTVEVEPAGADCCDDCIPTEVPTASVEDTETDYEFFSNLDPDFDIDDSADFADSEVEVKESLDNKYIDALRDKLAMCYTNEDLEEIGADLSKMSEYDLVRVFDGDATEADIEKMFGHISFVDDDFGLNESKEFTEFEYRGYTIFPAEDGKSYNIKNGDKVIKDIADRPYKFNELKFAKEYVDGLEKTEDKTVNEAVLKSYKKWFLDYIDSSDEDRIRGILETLVDSMTEEQILKHLGSHGWFENHPEIDPKLSESLKESKDFNPDIYKAIIRHFEYTISEGASEVFTNLVDRALLQDTDDTYDAVIQAVDDGLIYDDDLWEITKFYESPELSDVTYENLLNDLVGIVNVLKSGDLDEGLTEATRARSYVISKDLNPVAEDESFYYVDDIDTSLSNLEWSTEFNTLGDARFYADMILSSSDLHRIYILDAKTLKKIDSLDYYNDYNDVNDYPGYFDAK